MLSDYYEDCTSSIISFKITLRSWHYSIERRVIPLPYTGTFYLNITDMDAYEILLTVTDIHTHTHTDNFLIGMKFHSCHLNWPAAALRWQTIFLSSAALWLTGCRYTFTEGALAITGLSISACHLSGARQQLIRIWILPPGSAPVDTLLISCLICCVEQKPPNMIRNISAGFYWHVVVRTWLCILRGREEWVLYRRP